MTTAAPIARFYFVKRIGEDVKDTFATLKLAQDEARRLSAQQDGQFGVFELVDCYQSGQPPIIQVVIRK